ncbi:MAG: beta-galactosidase, partial [Candidatus Sumerlaeota bacterium]|nr:beta-galactosidase [Candidatus Sumerlaeota bacterium]
EEHFSYPNGSEGAPAWFAESIAWEVRDGAMIHAGAARDRSFLILEQAPCGKEVEIEATVTVQKRAAPLTDWSMAGVAVRLDGKNFWQFAMIEGPESAGQRRFIELAESLDGLWNAQSAPSSQLKTAAREGADFKWEDNHPYRLRIAMNPQGIEGTLKENDGAVRARLAFRFDKPAVTSGQPALNCAGMLAAFDDVKAKSGQPVAPPASAAPPKTPAYDAPGCEAVRSQATGFFHAKEASGRWWLIDPNGRGFYMVATDHVNYHGHGCEKLGYSPYGRVAQEKYKSEEAWDSATIARLKDWGFNSLAAGHSTSLRHRGLAFTEFLSLGASFAAIEDLCPRTTWTGFPNVFSPAWPRHCDKIARRQCAPLKDDPWLIGYFFDNELEWFGKQGKGLFDEAWNKPADHTAKQAWIKLLREEIKTIEAFNAGWGTKLKSFDELAGHTQPSPAQTQLAKDTEKAFVRLVARRYFETCAQAVRRHDPNHLTIGCRFAGAAPEIWDIAGESCDVVTFNIYPRIDVERGVPARVIEEITGHYQASKKPMMVTEWSFPALDAGLPSLHGAGMRVDTQRQRAQCFSHFQTMLFSLPFMVGSSYFMYLDEPALGISSTFPEDSNYGLISEKDEPYPELTAAARAVNPRACETHLEGKKPALLPRAQLADWLINPPPKKPAPPALLALSIGKFALKGPEGGIAWRLALGGVRLGDLHPLIHQQHPATEANLWVRPDRASITAFYENDRVSVVDMEFGFGAADKARAAGATAAGAAASGNDAASWNTPRRYRAAWRFWIPKAPPEWVASQCLWIENADDAPWRLAEIYHYLSPAIGGDKSNDEPLAEAPNYYLQGGAWVDKQANLGAGCWFANAEDFACTYWKDRDGHHADLRQKADVILRPGQRFEAPPVMAFFFPLEQPTRQAFGAAADVICKEVVATSAASPR